MLQTIKTTAEIYSNEPPSPTRKKHAEYSGLENNTFRLVTVGFRVSLISSYLLISLLTTG